MGEKKYTEEGYLVVAETDKCPLWELGSESRTYPSTTDCYYCKFADFRTEEFRIRAEEMPRGEKLHSVCKNEKNKKSATDTH